MGTYDDNVKALRRLKPVYENKRLGYMGTYNSDGTLNPNPQAGLTSEYVWIRFGEGRGATRVKNLRVRPALNLAVWVEDNVLTKESEVTGVHSVIAPEQFGGATAAALNAPPVSANVVSPVTGTSILPGGVFASSTGGLYVRIEPYFHRGGYWDGATELELTPTAATFSHSYVVVGIDTTTNTITQASTDEVLVGLDLDPASIREIIAANPDVDWRGAVDVENGDTAIDPAKIISLRGLGESKPRSNYSATGAPAVGDDVDDGYGVGSLWIDTTNDDVYQCVDSTAGAAVWVQLNAGALNNLIDVDTTGAGDGDVLTYDNGTSTWVASAPTGGTGGSGGQALYVPKLLYHDVLASNGRWDLTLASINATGYDYLQIVIPKVRSTVAANADQLRIYFNGDTTDTNYRTTLLYANSATASALTSDTPFPCSVSAASAPSDSWANVEMHLYNYGSATQNQQVFSRSARRESSTSQVTTLGTIEWENTAAITSITIQPDGYATDNLAAGSEIYVFGWKEQLVGGLATSDADVSSPPTAAELDTAFGTPAAVGAGFVGIVDDNGGDTDVYLVASNGASWWYTALTKAT